MKISPEGGKLDYYFMFGRDTRIELDYGQVEDRLENEVKRDNGQEGSGNH